MAFSNNPVALLIVLFVKQTFLHLTAFIVSNSPAHNYVLYFMSYYTKANYTECEAL